MLSGDEFRFQAGKIPYQYAHPPFLYALIRWLRPESVVEVGTHIGASAVWMARAIQENGRGSLACIDNFCWREEPNQERDWNDNIDRCGVRSCVTLLKGRSQEVRWPERVDFAYIDGNHSSDVCLHDVSASILFGASCICLNDTATCAGVQKVADGMRVSMSDWDFLEVPFDAGLLIAVKRKPRPAPTQGDFDPWDKS